MIQAILLEWRRWWLLLYSAVLCSRADSLHLHVILHEWLAFYSAFLNIHHSGVLTALAWLVPHETAAVSAQVLCTSYNHAPCHFMQSHICKVYACLAVTCRLHFWQNDWDLSCATAVTRGWNGYRNKNQHRKLTMEKKILPPLLQGFEPTTFQSWVWCSNHWAIPAPWIKQALCWTLAPMKVYHHSLLSSKCYCLDMVQTLILSENSSPHHDTDHKERNLNFLHATPDYGDVSISLRLVAKSWFNHSNHKVRTVLFLIKIKIK